MKHGIAELRRIHEANPSYFQPLTVWTVSGPVNLSEDEWLTVEEAKAASQLPLS